MTSRINWSYTFSMAVIVSMFHTCYGIVNDDYERQWICVKSEEVAHEHRKATTCKIKHPSVYLFEEQRRGFNCVQEYPTLLREVLQSSYENYQHRDALMNMDPNSCTTTLERLYEVFAIRLRKPQAIYAAQVSTKLGLFRNGTHPKFKVLTRSEEFIFCDLCYAETAPNDTKWVYLCPKGALGNQIYIQDQRPDPERFQLCTLKLFLTHVPPETPLRNVTLSLNGTTTHPVEISTLLPRTENMTDKESSKTSENGLVIALGILVGVFLVILSVVCWRKKLCVCNPPRASDTLPETHIYSSVVYEDIARRSSQPDLLEPCCNIYAVPDELETRLNRLANTSAEAKNELYEASSEPVEKTLESNDAVSCAVIGQPCHSNAADQIRNVDNDLYAAE